MPPSEPKARARFGQDFTLSRPPGQASALGPSETPPCSCLAQGVSHVRSAEGAERASVASTAKTLVLGPGPTQEHQLLTRCPTAFPHGPGSGHTPALAWRGLPLPRGGLEPFLLEVPKVGLQSAVTFPGKAPKPGLAGTVSGSHRHSCLGVLGQPTPTMGPTRSPHPWERAQRQGAFLHGPREHLPPQLRGFTRVRSAFQQLGGSGGRTLSRPQGVSSV